VLPGINVMHGQDSDIHTYTNLYSAKIVK